MCGKFTALASWSDVVEFSQPLTEGGGGEGPGGDDGSNDEIVTYRVGGLLPVIVWDAETRARRVVKMRWGFPDPKNWRRPRPIHARSETIDGKEPFRTPFHAGQRGIVIFRTFNEGEEVVKPSGRTETRQWTIDPKPAARLRLRVAAVRDFRSARPHAGVRYGDGARQRTHTSHDQVPGGRSPHAGDPGGRRLVDVAGRRRCNTSHG
jgi:hypothetical protein